MSLKTEHVSNRIIKGNKQADHVMNYMNHRFRTSFKGLGLDRDRYDGEDFGDEEVSFQVKIRDSKYGDDIPLETDQFWVNSEKKTYDRKPGRDVYGKSDFYVVKQKNHNVLLFKPTSKVKSMWRSVLKEWGVPTKKITHDNGSECIMADLSNEQIIEYWAAARFARHYKVFSSKKYVKSKPVEIWFKVDEGFGRRPFGKLIFYIPPDLIIGKAIELMSGELYNDPSTWRKRYADRDLESYK